MTADTWQALRRPAEHLLRAGARPLSDRAQDAALVVIVALASTGVLTVSHTTGLTHSYGLSLLFSLGAATTLFWRRTRPELCVLFAVLATSASDEASALIAASYAVGLYGGRTRGPLMAGVALLYLLSRSLTGEVVADPTWRAYMLVLCALLPAFYGNMVRRQRAVKQQLREQLSHAEAATEHAVRFSILERRTRLAFEIHDTVGHHTTFLVLRASAAEREPGLSSKAAAAFHDVQEEAIAVMHELRRVIAVLQEDEDPCASGGAFSVDLTCNEFLESLTRNMRAVGMRASYTVEGPVRPLGRATESLLYRVSREALTNAAKHAPGAPVRLSLAFAPRTVSLVVRNGRPLQRPVYVGDSGGLGLRSMRDAVHAVGGRFEAGPSEDGGYRTAAVIELPVGSVTE
ncbi:histidine kinase [Streptomyces sp. NPDC004667]|uniref:sensor histidine kinase n=1 Tax=Streptomyces sp. NPDC004667 TaxID=3154285 RepID=UPI0033ACB5E5